MRPRPEIIDLMRFEDREDVENGVIYEFKLYSGYIFSFAEIEECAKNFVKASSVGLEITDIKFHSSKRPLIIEVHTEFKEGL